MKSEANDIYEMLDTLALPAAAQRFAQLSESPELGVSVGRFSPFRVGLKTPISVNLKSPMHHVCH